MFQAKRCTTSCEWSGEDLLAYLKGVREDIEAVRARSERWTVQAGDATIGTVFLPRSDELPREPSNGVARFIRATGIESEIGRDGLPRSASRGLRHQPLRG